MQENKLRSLWAIISMNGLLPMKRQPLFLVNTLTSPFSFLFFLYVVSHGALLLYGVAGGFVLTVLSIGTSLQSDLTHYKVDLKFMEMAVASPVRAGTYVSGMALSELIFSLPAMAIFIVLAILYAHVILFAGLIIVGTLVLVWVFATALGFTLATYLADVRETFMISPIISIFLTVVPPVYYPIRYLPVWLQPLAYAAPTTWAAELVQGALGIAPLSFEQGAIAVGVLLVSATLLFLIALYKAKWRET